MAKRRVKKRTHAGARAGAPNGAANTKNMDRSPKSMVIRIGAGEVGPSVSQLVKDVRQVMEPGTAARLKERRSNKLRDYTTMAGPLGVTHLLLFSRSTSGNTNLRLAITPRGPTLHFRVEKYSLCKDIAKSQKHPKTGGYEYQTAPLLVMNNFNTPASASTDSASTASQPAVPKHLENLCTTVFQSLFPPISPQTMPLTSIRRVLLLNREPSTSASGAYRGLPNLGKLDDVADYLLDPSAGGYTSASESEVETDAEVEVLASSARKVLGKRDRARAASRMENGEGGGGGGRPGRSHVEKRAVKLVELGPRMRLRLTKVEEGICGGKVMWHEYIQKGREEVKEMDRVWDARRKEKEERRRVQKENVEKKRKERKQNGEADGEGEEDEDYDMDDDEWDSEGLEDAEEADGDPDGDENMDDEDMDDEDDEG
ncbi:rRNA-binding ribosome biosynthesis protein [Coniosporium tulheliwenetii]|uniref:rRNA-binding ribosome biosynthesis protein n=1 Tax=Coniosporium tulheliwenetii TaxID=3383036 RepID=A0ACC2ZQE5_9PEZI|nr:rRNA-binding ribosome biosynthesis protein [Cladosporium sp. JES 115]